MANIKVSSFLTSLRYQTWKSLHWQKSLFSKLLVTYGDNRNFWELWYYFWTSLPIWKMTYIKVSSFLTSYNLKYQTWKSLRWQKSLLNKLLVTYGDNHNFWKLWDYFWTSLPTLKMTYIKVCSFLISFYLRYQTWKLLR